MQVAHQQVEVLADRSSVPKGLAVVDLRKAFTTATGTRLDVLCGVTFEARPGESIAIMGASGSGKSTLLHLLGGLDEPDHGMIDFAGIDLRRLEGRSLASFRQKQIGFVFQFHYLLQDLSAMENVLLPLMISRQKKGDALSRANQLLQDFGLADRLDAPVNQLSGGEQQRVAVARALANNPTLVLADEPTGNLDSSIGDEIGRLLVEHAHKRSTIAIIATHNESLARLCDRAFILREGRVH